MNDEIENETESIFAFSTSMNPFVGSFRLAANNSTEASVTPHNPSKFDAGQSTEFASDVGTPNDSSRSGKRKNRESPLSKRGGPTHTEESQAMNDHDLTPRSRDADSLQFGDADIFSDDEESLEDEDEDKEYDSEDYESNDDDDDSEEDDRSDSDADDDDFPLFRLHRPPFAAGTPFLHHYSAPWYHPAAQQEHREEEREAANFRNHFENLILELSVLEMALLSKVLLSYAVGHVLFGCEGAVAVGIPLVNHSYYENEDKSGEIVNLMGLYMLWVTIVYIFKASVICLISAMSCNYCFAVLLVLGSMVYFLDTRTLSLMSQLFLGFWGLVATFFAAAAKRVFHKLIEKSRVKPRIDQHDFGHSILLAIIFIGTLGLRGAARLAICHYFGECTAANTTFITIEVGPIDEEVLKAFE